MPRCACQARSACQAPTRPTRRAHLRGLFASSHRAHALAPPSPLRRFAAARCPSAAACVTCGERACPRTSAGQHARSPTLVAHLGLRLIWACAVVQTHLALPCPQSAGGVPCRGAPAHPGMPRVTPQHEGELGPRQPPHALARPACASMMSQAAWEPLCPMAPPPLPPPQPSALQIVERLTAAPATPPPVTLPAAPPAATARASALGAAGAAHGMPQASAAPPQAWGLGELEQRQEAAAAAAAASPAVADAGEPPAQQPQEAAAPQQPGTPPPPPAEAAAKASSPQHSGPSATEHAAGGWRSAFAAFFSHDEQPSQRSSLEQQQQQQQLEQER